MSLRAREGRETPPRDESHDSVPVQYLQRSTSLTSDDHQFGLHSPAPVSRGLAELEPHITTSEATRTRGSSDSTPLDYIDAPTNSSESQVSPVKCSHKEPPPLWKVWWLEVGSILLSVISFIIIIVVLHKYDNGPIPRWPLEITLNSLVAFFTTIAKACFMIPVSIAISQAQWSWFLHDRPLYDLHVLDQASRGSLGSLVLLKRIKWTHFVVLGALLTVFSVLTSPVTQLTISYPVRDVLTQDDATAATVHTIRTLGTDITRRARTALALGALPYNNVIPLVACATGNCTFNQFESLGICMKMANITSQLSTEKFENPDKNLLNGSRNFTIFPGEPLWRASLAGSDFNLIHQTNMAAISDMFNWNDTSVFQDDSKIMQTRVASIYMIYTTPIVYNDTWQNGTESPEVSQILKGLPDFRHEALEIVYHMCVQSLKPTVRKGEADAGLISSLADPLEKNPPHELKMNCTRFLSPEKLQCRSTGTDLDKTLSLRGPSNATTGVSSSNFTAVYRSMAEIAYAMKRHLPGYFRADPNEIIYFGGTGSVFENFVEDVLYQPLLLMNTTLRNQRIQRFYEKIAVQLTASLREVKNRKTEDQTSFNVSGMAWREEAYVQVRWGWISFLAAEIFIATFFLAVTVIAQASDRGGDGSVFWSLKDSVLAHLIALSEECRVAAGSGLRHIDELKEKAVKLKVRFDGNKIVPAGATAAPAK